MQALDAAITGTAAPPDEPTARSAELASQLPPGRDHTPIPPPPQAHA